MRRLIAVIGAGECDARTAALAHEVGRRLAAARAKTPEEAVRLVLSS